MDRIGRHPVLVALLGAMCIAWSGPLVRLAEAPTTVQYAGTAVILVGVVLATATRPSAAASPLPDGSALLVRGVPAAP